MSIPAIEPPIDPGTPNSRPPGSKASRLTGAIDDSGGGSGVVIPLNQVDDAYVDWRMQTLDGWDSADLDEGAESKVGADGSWDAENFYSGRMLTITGVATAPTYEAREAAEYRLRQAIPARRLITVRIDETTPKYVRARRSGRLNVRPVTDTILQYSAVLLAPDMRKYGLDTVSAALAVAPPAAGLAPPWTPPITLPARPAAQSTATVTNVGTYETPPVIRITGPTPAVRLTNETTGLYLAYDVTLAATDYLLVDCATGVAKLNGVAVRPPVTGSAVTADFMIQPGANKLRLTGTAIDQVLVPGAAITFQPAWD